MLKLNPDLEERKAGYLFMTIWLLILAFYLTWDGWNYEWQHCGYDGPNQHFDLDLFDMQYELIGGQLKYHSTNNLHNIIYLCYIGLLFAWLGLLTGNKYLKHGAMSLTSVMLLAILFTINPVEDHLYVMQIVWDIVHLSGVAACGYLFYRNPLRLKWALPVILGTWIVYLLSRLMLQPWPFWEHDRLGYYGINQINKMPFYFYGMEYFLAIFILLIINISIVRLQPRFSSPRARTLLPFAIALGAYVVLLVLGLVEVENMDIGTCP